jgi:hypothetical protein
MANRTLIQYQLKMMHGIVQVRNCFACHVCGTSNLTFNDGIEQCAVLFVARTYNSSLQSEGRVIAINEWEGNVERLISAIE